MKKFILFFAFLISSFTISVNQVQAATNAIVASAATSISEPKTTEPKTATDPKTKEPKTAVKKTAWHRLTHPAETLRDGDNKDVIFYILAILLGTLGIHRVVMGADGIMILWYILIAIALGLVFTLLSILTAGLFGFFGWIIIPALPIFDIISALIGGTSYFQGNNDIFAGFKGLKGGK